MSDLGPIHCRVPIEIPKQNEGETREEYFTRVYGDPTGDSKTYERCREVGNECNFRGSPALPKVSDAGSP